jgi:hypothetical protein
VKFLEAHLRPEVGARSGLLLAGLEGALEILLHEPPDVISECGEGVCEVVDVAELEKGDVAERAFG